MKYFKFKDVFTALNLFLSFYAVILAFGGQFELGSYLILFSVLVLDILDGLVARLTKTGNEFGKHFDSIVDFLGSSVVVSFFVYIALKDANFYIAIGSSFLFLLTGVVREIKQRIEKIFHKGYFIGFPRNSAAVILIAFFNSTLYEISPFLLLPYLAILIFYQLSHVPFMGNDKKILLQIPRVRNYLILCLCLMVVHVWVGLFWNFILGSMCCYLLSPYVLVDRKVWDDVRLQVSRI